MKLIPLLVFCSVAFSCGQSTTQGTDLTLRSNASGPDVVRAVLSKIDASGAFGDSSTSLANVFMRRMAYVESRDGRITPYPAGGIWNVSQTTFQSTQGTQYQSTISSVYNTITSYFGLNWMTDIRFENLTKPLYSGLAVRLQLHYLELFFLNIIPIKSRQADYWINNIRGIRTATPTLRTQWDNAVEEIEETEACRVEADVVFVLDASGSISASDFDRVRNYTYNFADRLINNTDSHQNRIGVIVYSNNATVEIGLNSTLNQIRHKATLLQAIRNLTRVSGWTITPDGLCQLAAQPWRSGLVLRLGIVLTDGHANRLSVECGNLTQAAERAKQQSILIYALGVGGGVDTNELQVIASGPHFVDHVDSFSVGLETVRDVRSYEICFTAEQPVAVGQSSSESTGQGQTTRLSLRSPQEEGVTIRICIMAGRVILYVSTSVPNPSAALNDWAANVTATGQSVNCLTEFFSLGRNKRRRRQANSDASLYVAIEGIDTNNEFSFNSSSGNVSFDMNECEQNPLPCPEYASCHNTDGSFYCQCFSGFQTNGTECILDVNECEEDPTVCDENAVCQNTLGSFNCACSPGFRGNGTICEDVNECEEDLTVCDENAVCQNTHGSFNCTCAPGFRGNGTICEDVNECEEDPTVCDENALCQNTLGSFNCTCSPGFRGNGTICEDVNECEEDLTVCDENAVCQNTHGSFNCTCAPGFNGNGTICEDVNECEEDPTVCDENAVCQNTLGSFNCACSPGFRGNGTICEDVNECEEDLTVCDENAACQNTHGSFNCTCAPGFRGNGTICEDVNECEEDPTVCDENAVCQNTLGSFNCACSPGFRGNGTICEDVNECEEDPTVCDKNAVCQNTHGSFNCTCAPGFNGNGTICEDVNECEEDLTVCDENAACQNTLGSFNCTCSPGFRGNGTSCEDLNTGCEQDSKPCSLFKTCVNTLNGGHSCAINSQLITITTVLTVGPLLLVTTAVVVVLFVCSKKRQTSSSKKHTVINNTKKEAVLSNSSEIRSGKKHKINLKEPFQADKKFAEENDGYDSEEEWNYTMSIINYIWEQNEDLKTAYI